MVLFFTGTGNSLYVAKNLDDERFSIPQIINDEKREYRAEKIGIVCPIYGHEMPDLVKQFIKQTKFHADYINTIMMVDNYLPVFDMNEQIELDPKKKVDEHIAAIKEDIEARKHWKQEATLTDRIFHQGYLKMSRKNPIDIKGGIFKVLDYCIGCGICMHVCPTGTIQVENQYAQYKDTNRCQMCLACVQHCPKNAIRLKIPEKNPNARYHNGNIRLSEIVEANNQMDDLV